MLASDIILKVADKCQESSATDEDILALINEARGQIADDYDLPNLKATSTVTTVTTGNTVALPDNYHKGLFYVASANQKRRIGERVSDYHNINTLLGQYPTVDTVGQITNTVVEGDFLLYQGQDDDTLTLRFYALIADITEIQEPVELPKNMHIPLLMNYCLKEIYDAIEDETEGPKVNTTFYERRYQVALARLQKFIERSRPKEPKYVKDTDY